MTADGFQPAWIWVLAQSCGGKTENNQEEIKEMSLRRSTTILFAILLMATIVLSACAPAKPAATAPSTPPTAPAATPATPAAPATTPPAAPAAPQVTQKPTSFESATYSNDQYGFNVRYPKSWANDKLIGEMVWRVAAQAGDLQSDGVAAAVVNKPADYGKAIKENADATLAASGVNAKTKLESINPTTLSDGKTPAMEAVLSAEIFGIYQLYVYALSTDKGEKTIATIGLTLKGDTNKALIKEIVQTLAVK
jgi:hypothetical protein